MDEGSNIQRLNKFYSCVFKTGPAGPVFFIVWEWCVNSYLFGTISGGLRKRVLAFRRKSAV